MITAPIVVFARELDLSGPGPSLIGIALYLAPPSIPIGPLDFHGFALISGEREDIERTVRITGRFVDPSGVESPTKDWIGRLDPPYTLRGRGHIWIAFDASAVVTMPGIHRLDVYCDGALLNSAGIEVLAPLV